MTGAGVVLLTTFLASSVEAIEMVVIVLGVGATRGWRSTVLGAVAGLGVVGGGGLRGAGRGRRGSGCDARRDTDWTAARGGGRPPPALRPAVVPQGHCARGGPRSRGCERARRGGRRHSCHRHRLDRFCSRVQGSSARGPRDRVDRRLVRARGRAAGPVGGWSRGGRRA